LRLVARGRLKMINFRKGDGPSCFAGGFTNHLSSLGRKKKPIVRTVAQKKKSMQLRDEELRRRKEVEDRRKKGDYSKTFDAFTRRRKGEGERRGLGRRGEITAQKRKGSRKRRQTPKLQKPRQDGTNKKEFRKNRALRRGEGKASSPSTEPTPRGGKNRPEARGNRWGAFFDGTEKKKNVKGETLPLGGLLRPEAGLTRIIEKYRERPVGRGRRWRGGGGGLGRGI